MSVAEHLFNFARAAAIILGMCAGFCVCAFISENWIDWKEAWKVRRA